MLDRHDLPRGGLVVNSQVGKMRKIGSNTAALALLVFGVAACSGMQPHSAEGQQRHVQDHQLKQRAVHRLSTGRGVVKAVLPLTAGQAKNDAENAVGPCLQQTWGNEGFNNLYDTYEGNGKVTFTALGGPELTVQVESNGRVLDSRALKRAGCPPYVAAQAPEPPPAEDTYTWSCSLAYNSAVATVTATGNAPVPADSVVLQIDKVWTQTGLSMTPYLTVHNAAEIEPGQTIRLEYPGVVDDSVVTTTGCEVVNADSP
jgi:hypothetical protein